MKRVITSIFETLFPRWCVACNCKLPKGQEVVCITCRCELPYTNFFSNTENKLDRTFWGRVPIERAYALFYYTKGGVVGEIIHQLKYNAIVSNGKWIGRAIGYKLHQHPPTRNFDCIIPIPLHRKKERQRGYNQATIIAHAISEILNIEVREDILIKIENTQSQTKRGRYDRWKNSEESYAVRKNLHLKNVHLLLVDDVITTGATIEACAQALLSDYQVEISVVAAAYTL